MRRWIVIFFCLTTAYLVYYLKFSSPLPDLGTPALLAPREHADSGGMRAEEPEGSLVPIAVHVPERWAGSFPTGRNLLARPGFSVSVFAAGVSGARFLAMDGEGNLYVSRARENSIAVLRDADRDGTAETVLTFASGLRRPHGMAFKGKWLYVAGTDRVDRLRDSDGDGVADKKETVTDDVPGGGMHFTRTLGFGPEGRLFVSVGSSCNVCEDEPGRAAILEIDEAGGGVKPYAQGLRNAVGFVWHPDTGEMWATENSRDWLGDDLPPDEINVIVQDRHYGWPYCYGDRVPDPAFDRGEFCKVTEPARVALQAHSAPLGLRFCTGCAFPDQYQGNLFVAYHGSWNRRVPTGYKVVRVRFDGDRPIVEDFLAGWLVDGEKWGRPVDILFDGRGDMFISDDYGGVIYKAVFKKKE